MHRNESNMPESTISPLKHDFEGRFSRNGIPVKGININLIEGILIFLFIFFLSATDFILFAGSGNLKVFNNSIFPIPEVSLVLLFLAVIVSLLVYFLHKYRTLRYIVAALFSLGFILILFNQFSQAVQNINIGNNVIPLYIVLGFVFCGITFAVLAQNRLIYKILSVFLIVIMFFNVYWEYMHTTNTEYEYLESHNTQKNFPFKGKRFIYFMFPNLVSYQYLSTISGMEADKTQKIMQGFLQKNKFKLYTKAYNLSENYLDNMISNLNPSSEENNEKHILKNKILHEYWRFHNLNNEYIYLKNNELYDIFHKNNFQVSAYKSRDFDMCHSKHKYNVNRCMEKINKPTNIYDIKSPVEKAKILFIEWLSSFNIFNNMTFAYNLLNIFVNVDNMPLIGVNYNNLYVVNSVKTFDVLLQNVREDSGKQAYFVFIDMPSDMYIYDEFCHIKPRDKWLNMVNLPWIKNDYTEKRQQAYLQQTRCLFGKLEYFISQLKQENLLDNTVVIMQGISGVNNFKYYAAENENIKNNFMTNNVVTMAIYSKHNKNFSTDDKICSTKGILGEYLYKTTRCHKFNVNIHHKIMQEIDRDLDYLSANLHKDMIPMFNKWYKKWVLINAQNSDNKELIVQDINTLDEDFGLGDVDLSDIELNAQVFEK
ncbi:MAG: hypothetical protein MJ212_03750 [Alphaproteobacteria bacterium]|nr:hypothetical protein [Alphaproteobacteria bacterium]